MVFLVIVYINQIFYYLHLRLPLHNIKNSKTQANNLKFHFYLEKNEKQYKHNDMPRERLQKKGKKYILNTFFLFLAILSAYGSSQARNQIQATASTYAIARFLKYCSTAGTPIFNTFNGPFSLRFEQGPPYFHFAFGSINYVAGPG